MKLGINLGITSSKFQSTVITQAIAILRRFGSDAHAYLPGIGTLSGLQTANYLDSALTTPATVDNPVGGVVDAIGSINATQATTAAKPRLERGVRNLALWSATLSNATWVKNAGVSVSGNVVTGASGTTWGGAGIITNSVINLLSSTPYTAAFLLKSSGATTATIYLRDQSTGNVSSSVLALTADSQMVTVTRTSGAATTSLALMLGNADGDVYLESAGLFVGTLTAQQILAEGGIPLTTTAAASNPSAGKYSWAFDGGDSLSLGSVPFQMSDDHWVVCAVSPSSLDAIVRRIFETAAAGEIYLAVNNVGVTASWKDDAATVDAVAYNLTLPLGSWVVLAMRKVGNIKRLRYNGAFVGNTGSTPMGATTLTNSTIGNRAAADRGLLGSTGPIIAGKGTLTDSEMLTLERLASSLTPNGPTF